MSIISKFRNIKKFLALTLVLLTLCYQYMVRRKLIYKIIFFVALLGLAVVLVGIYPKQRDHSILISHYSLPSSGTPKKKFTTKTVIIFKGGTIQLVANRAYMVYDIEEYIKKDKTYILEMTDSNFLPKASYPDVAYLALRGDQIWYLTVGLRFQQSIIFYIDERQI